MLETPCFTTGAGLYRAGPGALGKPAGDRRGLRPDRAILPRTRSAVVNAAGARTVLRERVSGIRVSGVASDLSTDIQTMNVFLGVRIPVGKILRGAAVAAAGLAAVVAAGCSVHSASETPSNERPPSATAPIQPATPVASTTATAEPSASPSASQPEATASESFDASTRPGKIVAKFKDGPQGPYFILAPMDASQSALEAAWQQRGSLEYSAKQRAEGEDLDVTAIPIASAWRVNVSMDEFASYELYAVYPSSGDTAPSSTDR
ncbi:hypothetical protein BS35_006314 [Actinomadura glauciflava]|nr:hypothetical protein [Actinomadura glauciflava]